MNRNGQIAGIGLTLALSLIVLGWVESFPVSLAAAEDSNLLHISPLFWIGLLLAYPAVFLVGINSDRPVWRLLCSVVFIFLFTAPKLLYLQTGSDTETFVGLLDIYNGMTSVHFEDEVYSQWPMLTMWGRLIQLFCRCDSALVYWLFWGIQIVGFGTAGYLLFSQEPSNSPADFLGLYLWASVLFWFWDWQVSAYNLSLVFVFVIFSLLPREQWRFRLVIIFLFTTLAFSHGFVPTWILTAIPLIVVLELLARLPQLQPIFSKLLRVRAATHGAGDRLVEKSPWRWLPLFLILTAIHMAILFFHSTRLVQRIVLILQNYYTSFLQEQLSVNTVTRYVSMAATAPTDPFDIVTKWLAWFDLGLNLLLIGLCLLFLWWRKRAVLLNWAVFLTGSAHYIAGNFLPVLGPRALNIIMILPVRGLNALLQEKRLRKPVLAVFFLAITLYPVNLVRLQMRHTQYNTFESFRATRYVAPFMAHDVEQGASEIRLLTDQPQFQYLRLSLPRSALEKPDYRAPEPDTENFQYVLNSTEVAAALAIRQWPDLATITAAPDKPYNRIYDSGRYVWLVQANGPN